MLLIIHVTHHCVALHCIAYLQHLLHGFDTVHPNFGFIKFL